MQKASMLRDARTFAPGWRIWFVILQVTNGLMPLFFIVRPAAWMTLTAYLLSASLILILHARLGWVRLLGIGHAPLLVLMAVVLPRYAANWPAGPFGIWLLSMFFVNGVCLTIDAVDLVRYLRGERAPLA